jgi:hypothetical protein
MIRVAASAALPCRFAQTTSMGNARNTQRVGRRAWDASSHTSPVYSGSTKTWARIVNVHGAAISTGKKRSTIARGPAPRERAPMAAITKAKTEQAAATTASSP